MKNNLQETDILYYMQSNHFSKSLRKRGFDLIVSFFLLVLLFPILCAIAISIFICDGRPVIFKQKRNGLHGKEFIIWKFRTMRSTDHVRGEQYDYSWGNGVPSQFIFKNNYNPNITPIGVILRKYSLDELPQLINVIKGDMSIVGPRPEIPQITRYYNNYQSQRLLVKPGITGLAQVNGRSEISHGQKIDYDIQYVVNCSFKMDLLVIWNTALQVFRGKGAY